MVSLGLFSLWHCINIKEETLIILNKNNNINDNNYFNVKFVDYREEQHSHEDILWIYKRLVIEDSIVYNHHSLQHLFLHWNFGIWLFVIYTHLLRWHRVNNPLKHTL